MRRTSRITDWEPPHRLTYEQARGPYRWFRHEHSFETEGDGTRVVDKVIYRAPGGQTDQPLSGKTRSGAHF
jgi:ligand-binding SRPBCC domain-containing protein